MSPEAAAWLQTVLGAKRIQAFDIQLQMVWAIDTMRMFLQVWHSHMQPLADAMMALQTQKLAVGMQLQVRAPELHICETRIEHCKRCFLLQSWQCDLLKRPCKDTRVAAATMYGTSAAAQESWWRQLQVLPARTHPTMSTSGTGGYLLSGTRVVAPGGVGAPGATAAPKAVAAPGTVVAPGATVVPKAAGEPGAAGVSAVGGKRQRTS
jgi:hypothetical protein